MTIVSTGDSRDEYHPWQPPVIAHDYDFDPTYGYDGVALEAIVAPEPPSDFEEFWSGIRDRARAVDPSPTIRELPERIGKHRVFRIQYRSLGDVLIHGWLVLPPTGEEVGSGVVVGHGYGGRDGPDLPPGLESGVALLFPCARGMSLSAEAAPGTETSDRHVVFGIESREDYIHGGCVADFICAVSALLALFPQITGRVGYIGGSFGGGIGALMLPWEDRIRRAHIGEPSFGHHPLRLTMPCVGSGESVRRLHRRDPSVAETLAYFDAAIAARWISVPTLVAPSMFDPAVPPPGQFAINNSIAPEYRTTCVQRVGHFAHRFAVEDSRVLHEAIRGHFGPL